MRIARLVRCTTILALAIASAAPARAQAKPQTATQFYMEYLVAFGKATKSEDLDSFVSAKRLKELKTMPKADREKVFGFIKAAGTVTEAKVTKEEHTPDGGAILTVEALDTEKSKVTGKITIAKEAGAWKMVEEEWGS